MKLIDAKDMNGPMERIQHVSSLLKFAAELTEQAKQLVPLVEPTQSELCDAMSDMCGELSDIAEELQNYSDILARMVNKYYAEK